MRQYLSTPLRELDSLIPPAGAAATVTYNKPFNSPEGIRLIDTRCSSCGELPELIAFNSPEGIRLIDTPTLEALVEAESSFQLP